MDQPALGGLEEARKQAISLGERIFKAILRTSWKCAGPAAINVKPLDIVTVEGFDYRLLNINRRYNADRNEILTEYSAEWLGGDQGNSGG